MSSSVVQSSSSSSGIAVSTTRSPTNGPLLYAQSNVSLELILARPLHLDPHALPTFTSTDAVVKPLRTVLYLPPMLSSLYALFLLVSFYFCQIFEAISRLSVLTNTPATYSFIHIYRPQEFSDDETRYASSAGSPRTVYENELASPVEKETESAAPAPVAAAAPGSAAPPSPKNLADKLANANLTEGRLPHIDPVSLELHRALHHFRPVTENYSAEPYHESFNWDDLELPEHMEGEWYCVAFRSRRKVASLNDEFNNCELCARSLRDIVPSASS